MVSYACSRLHTVPTAAHFISASIIDFIILAVCIPRYIRGNRKRDIQTM